MNSRKNSNHRLRYPRRPVLALNSGEYLFPDGLYLSATGVMTSLRSLLFPSFWAFLFPISLSLSFFFFFLEALVNGQGPGPGGHVPSRVSQAPQAPVLGRQRSEVCMKCLSLRAHICAELDLGRLHPPELLTSIPHVLFHLGLIRTV